MSGSALSAAPVDLCVPSYLTGDLHDHPDRKRGITSVGGQKPGGTAGSPALASASQTCPCENGTVTVVVSDSGFGPVALCS